jgi:hypothetical protein
MQAGKLGLMQFFLWIGRIATQGVQEESVVVFGSCIRLSTQIVLQENSPAISA